MLGLRERSLKERSLSERHPVLERPGAVKGRARFAWLSAGSAAVFVAVLGMVLGADSGSPSSQGVGNVCILLAALIAAVSCANAARTRPEQSRAWLFLTIAALVYAAGMSIWTYYGITLNHKYPFPSAADLGFLGYAVPAAIGLFLFPRALAPLVARLRAVLDALVIGAAANIGANGAVAICQELEELGRAHKDGDPELLARLETELALVEKALHRALLPTP